MKVFYGTQTGNSKKFAEILAYEYELRGYGTEVVDLKTYDPEDNLVEENANGNICVFIISTYTDGQPPEGASWFYKWLTDTSDDFRVQKTLLKGLYYTIVGLGNSVYKDNYCTVAKKLDKSLHDLSATKFSETIFCDENTVNSLNGGLESDFAAWRENFWKKAQPALNGRKVKDCGKKCDGKCACSKPGVDGQEAGPCSSDEGSGEEENQFNSKNKSSPNKVKPANKTSGVVDLEDLGKIMKKAKICIILYKRKKLFFFQQNKDIEETGEVREMITPLLRQSLEKQGYKLIGSHSGVKLCRWTKSMLRGRGGCYKHTFYGIESHRCMETTPSLACANKCVFCWRHHTNPVGTEWKWKMDDAETLIAGALKNHTKMINEFKGVPGVIPERFQEGMNPQHCALSLVGEPIMYPEINKFIDLLHEKHISTFLVTNAQFPDAIRELTPITQLYVSVDANTKETLKKIDRPLFKDFWERFIECLKRLGEKGQRTVYRLTLVKAWNTEEIENYAKLVDLGRPDFIEVKGVTYCGDSKASSLTMENVPWHEEVIKFVTDLTDRLPDYEIASEHEHSNCLLLAHKKLKVKGEWWTWIDYPKFHELISEYTLSNGKKTFTTEDYMAKTPPWAVYGATERGFDPLETRHHRKKQKDISGC
ncbi:hypothetical protein LOTGIDRAFT_135774 [Lottia gigantea]|uniref:S-adenosyl-L-methionine-dependent tRNA 4-demethylwyosine synthase TYW1 n=1 Tax=Lottia gigantea TaxID=225164 RepID=V4CQI9_LOTGI|nr:hypothetical protein LOTGIDRAFT_135774 [Lottia gigantea]ESP04730.1 hypothetical protein LOTGIDRAFT_135774 [Lottia gigantea]